MSDNCRQERPSLQDDANENNATRKSNVPYKEPAKDSNFYGLESHFNEYGNAFFTTADKI